MKVKVSFQYNVIEGFLEVSHVNDPFVLGTPFSFFF